MNQPRQRNHLPRWARTLVTALACVLGMVVMVGVAWITLAVLIWTALQPILFLLYLFANAQP